MLLSTGAVDLEEIFRPKPVGEPVNTHVVERVKEPEPDYAAMKRVIEGYGSERETATNDERERRKVPTSN